MTSGAIYWLVPLPVIGVLLVCVFIGVWLHHGITWLWLNWEPDLWWLYCVAHVIGTALEGVGWSLMGWAIRRKRVYLRESE